MQRYEVALKSSARGIVVRPRPNGSPQTLIFFLDRIQLLKLGVEGSPFELGSELVLTHGTTGAPYNLSTEREHWRGPVYDPTTDCVYFIDGYALMRLDAANAVTLVAGSRTESGTADGFGAAARFEYTYSLATDCRGALYCTDSARVRRIVLIKYAAVSGDVSGASGIVTTAVTLPRSTFSLAYNPVSQDLLAATLTALYRLPMPADGAATTGGGGGGGGGSPAPVLLAGREDSPGATDSEDGSAVRFRDIVGLRAGASGLSAYLLCGGRLRVVDLRTGAARTVAELVAKNESRAQMVVLPGCGGGGGGCMAVGIWGQYSLHFVEDPKEDFSAIIGGGNGDSAAAAAALAPDLPYTPLAELLLCSRSSDSSGKGTSASPTVRIRVGDRSYDAHRSVLAARSEYFRQLLGGGFAEGSAAEVELCDADPEAFAPLLSYMYTGTLDVADAQLRPVAELAGALLLPGATARLQQRLLPVSTPASLLADLVWAERHSLRELAAGLRVRAVSNMRKVAEVTPAETVRQLMADCPDVMAELFLAVGLRAAA